MDLDKKLIKEGYIDIKYFFNKLLSNNKQIVFYIFLSTFLTGSINAIPLFFSKKVLNISQKAVKLLNCRGITRCDFRFYNNQFFLLEVNTQPGMTNLSLVPEIAKYAKISFPKLVQWIVNDSSINR